MKAVLTHQLLEYGRNRGYSVSTDEGQDADLFCWWCGSAVVIAITNGTGFSPRTGKAEHVAYGRCPKRRSPLSKHTNERLRLDQEEMDKLLYQYVLDVTVPNRE